MLKIVFVLGCLLCLTLAYLEDDLGSNREERSPRGHSSHRGRGPPRGKDGCKCGNDDLLKCLEALFIATGGSTTTAATSSVAPTTTGAPTTSAATTPTTIK